ncbi:MAG: hypothetical protein HY704_02560 [Gemmatimonadetes bacterium]|nr:hypothetical protein [Gemmatimonadota bacterium]
MWGNLAPMLLGIVLVLTVGGVILLRPLASRLGDLLEVRTQERLGGRGPGQERELARIRELMESINQRLALLEERQDFTDALLRNPERARLESGAGERKAERAG